MDKLIKSLPPVQRDIDQLQLTIDQFMQGAEEGELNRETTRVTA